MKLLLTGFEPFGGSQVNPSEQVVRRLDGKATADWTVHGCVLPVDNQAMPPRLLEALNSLDPRAVLCLGEAGRRPAVSLERIAVNLQDYELPDNRGERITDRPIRADGPAGYFSTLPLRSIYDRLRAAGIPVEYSLSAGAYLCNLAFYTLMDHYARQNVTRCAGFIHLPSLPEQAAARTPPSPSMDLAVTLRAVEIAIGEIIAAH